MRKITTHPSGLKLITFEMSHMNSVSVGIWVGTGARYEKIELSGVSHFIEHLLFKGTENRTGKEISQTIEGLGGALNAFTGEEYTCYYSKVLSEYLDTTFDVLWDMVMNNTFSNDDINKEKSVVKEEINMYQDIPAQYVQDILSKVMWPDQPLGRMILGSEQTVDALTNDKLVEYKKKYYNLNNIIISAAGKIDHDKMYQLVEKYIEKQSVSGDEETPVPVVEKQINPEVNVFNKDTEQVHIALGVRALPREHEDRYILKVLNTILGENMSSRLFQVVREKHGLAYSIHSSIERYNDTGALIVSAGTEEKNLYKAIELIVQETKCMKDSGITDDELERGKRFSIGQLSLGLEKTMNVMLWMGESLLCSKKVSDIDEILKKIQSVTKDDIARVSEKVFTNANLNLAVIGPVSNEQKLKEIFTY